MRLGKIRTAEEEAFWQKLLLPEDDLRRQDCPRVPGGYRWFRAPNVIPIERWKRLEAAWNASRSQCRMEAPERVRGMRRRHEPRGQPHFALPPNLYMGPR